MGIKFSIFGTEKDGVRERREKRIKREIEGERERERERESMCEPDSESMCATYTGM